MSQFNHLSAAAGRCYFCGHQNLAGEIYCSECGEKVGGAVPELGTPETASAEETPSSETVLSSETAEFPFTEADLASESDATDETVASLTALPELTDEHGNVSAPVLRFFQILLGIAIAAFGVLIYSSLKPELDPLGIELRGVYFVFLVALAFITSGKIKQLLISLIGALFILFFVLYLNYFFDNKFHKFYNQVAAYHLYQTSVFCVFGIVLISKYRFGFKQD